MVEALGRGLLRSLWLGLALGALCCPVCGGADEPSPPTNYRNLFAEAGRSQREVRAKVDAAFAQLYHGDAADEAVYFAAEPTDDGPAAYILDVGHDDVRSEGVSYGMMIAVQLDRRAEFDALWNWACAHMREHDPSHPAYGYFAWSVSRDGRANDEMPAADGEEYLATALYFAAHRWGSREGIYDYRAEADRLLVDMRHRREITGPTRFGAKKTMTAAELFSPKHAMVRFTPDLANRDHTDPSYHLPAFYELWARWGPEEDRDFWRRAASASREFFALAAHPQTALTPEYAEFDGSPWAAPWHPQSEKFLADSWRSAMNWSVDWAWWGADDRARERSDRLQQFFEGVGLADYGSSYELDGRRLGGAHSTGLVAMNAVAGLAAKDEARARRFADQLWKAPVPTGQWRYYDGMLYLLGLLHCGGEFRVWAP
jgi:oligosaccharide reducing-end xylanase